MNPVRSLEIKIFRKNFYLPNKSIQSTKTSHLQKWAVFSKKTTSNGVKNSRGFTLIEALVSVAIITVISGAVLVYFGGGNKNWALTRAAQKASQDIRRAQNMALSSPTYTCPAGKIYGYGVYFNTSANTSYILFADCNNNNSYDGESLDVKIETISIETGIKICTLETFTNGTPTSVSSFSIVFVPPDPTTKFSGGDTITKNRITLCLITDASKTRQLKINSKGNVDIQ